MSEWQTKSSKVVYENPWLIIKEDEVVMPNGKDGLYGVVSSKSDAVFVVPIDTAGNTYLVQQEHYTTRELAWQCIAGRTDGEPAEIAAKRELLEEAGLAAEQITIMSSARTATGMTTFRTSLCLAEHLSEDMSHFDSGEINQVKKVPLADIPRLIFAGEIAATESIAALLMATEYLKIHRKNHAPN
ncbi:NUDIX hydrolase [Candidatus Saccharibacteria bacterium]|nr:NUDIX hydrolase [Candidatus Saccharibacteria bacterium]MBH2007622.1 NUDIX hydrolase [Candidatus Saccharibacteria bacterium]